MKIAAAFLADAANIREGTLSVLSGFINQLWKEEFPAPLGATLVVVAEVPADLSQKESKSENFSFSIRDVDSDESVADGGGGLEVETEQNWASYAPIVIPLSEVEVRTPGTYAINVQLGDQHKRIEFYVSDMPSD